MYEITKEGCVDMKIQAVLIDGFKNLSNVKILIFHTFILLFFVLK